MHPYFLCILFFQSFVCIVCSTIKALTVKNKCQMLLQQSVLWQQFNKSNILFSSHQQCHFLASQHRATRASSIAFKGFTFWATACVWNKHGKKTTITTNAFRCTEVLQYTDLKMKCQMKNCTCVRRTSYITRGLCWVSDISDMVHCSTMKV